MYESSVMLRNHTLLSLTIIARQLWEGRKRCSCWILILVLLIWNMNSNSAKCNYGTSFKNSPTLNFVRRKSSVQVDSNCEEFPVSLIHVITLESSAGRKVLFQVDADCDNFPVSLPMIASSCSMNIKDTCET